MGRFTKRLGLLLCLTVSSSLANADDLMTILELARENDPALRQAEAQYRSRQEQVNQSRANLLPSLSASGSTTRQTSGLTDSVYGPRIDRETGEPVTDPDTGQVIIDRVNDHSFQPGANSHGYRINLSQSVLNFSQWYSYQSARAADEVYALNFASQEQELIMRVAAAYFDTLRAYDNLETSRQEEQAARRQLDQTRQREEVGLISVTEVYESQAAFDLARNNTILAENEVLSRHEALEALTGQPHPDIEVLSEDFPINTVEGDLDSWVDVALENNLALEAARAQVGAQEELVKARKADHLPSISFSGSFSHNVSASRVNEAGISTSGGARDGTSLSLNLNIPLYSGGAIRSRRRAAEYDLIASQEQRNLLHRQTTQDIRNAYRRVNTDALVISQRQQAINSARSALDATELGYEVGTRDIVNVLQARQSLFIALRNYSDARYNYVLDSLLLKQIAGNLTPQDVIDLNQWLQNED